MIRESVSRGIDVSIRGASVVREQWRNHGAHVDPVASSLPFINTGFTYPTPRIRTCPEKRSRTKGGEEIRTRIERGKGFDRRKVGQETISPFSTDKYFMRFNPASVSSPATGSSLFSFIKPYLPKSVSLRLRIRDCKTMAPRECRIKSENRSRGRRDIGEGFLRDAGETRADSPFLEWEIYKNLEKMGNGWLFSFHRIPLESATSFRSIILLIPLTVFLSFPKFSTPPRVFRRMNNSWGAFAVRCLRLICMNFKQLIKEVGKKFFFFFF